MSFTKNWFSAQKDSQKAPNEVKATAPNVLPVRNSHMPASSWASPPYASARPSTTGSPPLPTRPALNMLRTNVVSANAPSPRGPGSAVIGSTRATPLPESTLARAASPRVGSRAVLVPASIVRLPLEDGQVRRSNARQAGASASPLGHAGAYPSYVPAGFLGYTFYVRSITRRRPRGSWRRPGLRLSRSPPLPGRRRGAGARGSAS